MMTKERNSRTNCHRKDIICHPPGVCLPVPSTKQLLLLLPSAWVYFSPRTHSKRWSLVSNVYAPKDLKGPGFNDITSFRNANSVQPIKIKRACGPSRRAWCLSPASPTRIPSGCSAVSCRPSPRMAERSGKCPGKPCGLQLTEQARIASSGATFKGSRVAQEHCRSNPRVRTIPWRRKWQPTPIFLPGESHGQRGLVGYSPQGRKESDMAE